MRRSALFCSLPVPGLPVPAVGGERERASAKNAAAAPAERARKRKEEGQRIREICVLRVFWKLVPAFVVGLKAL